MTVDGCRLPDDGYLDKFNVILPAGAMEKEGETCIHTAPIVRLTTVMSTVISYEPKYF